MGEKAKLRELLNPEDYLRVIERRLQELLVERSITRLGRLALDIILLEKVVSEVEDSKVRQRLEDSISGLKAKIASLYAVCVIESLTPEAFSRRLRPRRGLRRHGKHIGRRGS